MTQIYYQFQRCQISSERKPDQTLSAAQKKSGLATREGWYDLTVMLCWQDHLQRL